MRSYWTRVGPKSNQSMTGVLLRGGETQTQRGDSEGRDWSNAFTSHRGKVGKILPLNLRRNQLCQFLDFRFWPPELGKKRFLLF